MIRHLHIQDEKAMMNCTNYFLNATTLTLLYSFNESIDHLNRILPLSQMTQLLINCDGFCFTKVIQLLQFTPNIHKLRVYSMDLYSTDCESIKKSETFQLVSKTNLIKNFTVESGCQLEEMKLLAQLCPRLEHIDMEIYWTHFNLIFELILSKTNDHFPDLFSLCLKNVFRSSNVNRLKTLIEENKWLDHYSMKLVCSKLYLWW
jgi:hypothetical protein